METETRRKRLKTLCKLFSLMEAVLVGGGRGPLHLLVGPPPRGGGADRCLCFGICFSDVKSPMSFNAKFGGDRPLTLGRC